MVVARSGILAVFPAASLALPVRVACRVLLMCADGSHARADGHDDDYDPGTTVHAIPSPSRLQHATFSLPNLAGADDDEPIYADETLPERKTSAAAQAMGNHGYNTNEPLYDENTVFDVNPLVPHSGGGAAVASSALAPHPPPPRGVGNISFKTHADFFPNDAAAHDERKAFESETLKKVQQKKDYKKIKQSMKVSALQGIKASMEGHPPPAVVADVSRGKLKDKKALRKEQKMLEKELERERKQQAKDAKATAKLQARLHKS